MKSRLTLYTCYNSKVMLRKHLNTVQIYLLEVASLLSRYGDVNKKMHIPHTTRVTMARLYLTELLPCVNRLIYLDLDCTVLSSLTDLWKTHMTEGSCGVAGRQSVDVGFARQYVTIDEARALHIDRSILVREGFNAGVLVLDLETIRSSFKLPRSLENFKAVRKVLSRQNDQTILNAYCNGNFIRLDPMWNVFYSSGKVIDNMRYKAVSDWRIFHWTGPSKLWNRPIGETREDKEFQRKLNLLLKRFKKTLDELF